MREPKLYENVKQIGMKLLSLLVSMKYQFAACATIAFFMGKLDAWLWVATVCLTCGIRGVEKLVRFREAYYLEHSEDEADEPVTVMEAIGFK